MHLYPIHHIRDRVKPAPVADCGKIDTPGHRFAGIPRSLLQPRVNVLRFRTAHNTIVELFLHLCAGNKETQGIFTPRGEEGRHTFHCVTVVCGDGDIFLFYRLKEER